MSWNRSLMIAPGSPKRLPYSTAKISTTEGTQVPWCPSYPPCPLWFLRNLHDDQRRVVGERSAGEGIEIREHGLLPLAGRPIACRPRRRHQPLLAVLLA